MTPLKPAPELLVETWLNAAEATTLAAQRGRVVYLLAFQRLCAGCADFALPQSVRLRSAFDAQDLVVFGLHTVFESHAAQGSRAALSAFLEKSGIAFPVAIDAASPEGGLPLTMRAYGMQGTPTSILVDRGGRLRLHRFGHVDDIRLGASVQALIDEATG